MRPIRKSVEVEDGNAALQKFANLTGKLLAVPKSELDAELAKYEKRKRQRKRLREKRKATR